MAKTYVLFNKKAGVKNDMDSLPLVKFFSEGETEFVDISKITNYKVFFSGLDKEDKIIISGGDGTLNNFANNIYGLPFEGDILYYANGTGNDFALDMGHGKQDTPFSIKEHLQNLPTVSVKDKDYRFINGVGYGIDGYCCEVGDKLKEQSDEPVNYTAIAIKGLLFHYKPADATVTVDGKKYEFKKVWLAPTMHGRYYGGGMMPTPNQSREDNEKLSVMIFHGSNKIKTLMIFPSIFKGEHIKHEKNVTVLEGKNITVEFSEPRPLQIDGETILDVKSYTAKIASIE